MDNAPEAWLFLTPSEHHSHLSCEGGGQPVPYLGGHGIWLDIAEFIFCIQQAPVGGRRTKEINRGFLSEGISFATSFTTIMQAKTQIKSCCCCCCCCCLMKYTEDILLFCWTNAERPDCKVAHLSKVRAMKKHCFPWLLMDKFATFQWPKLTFLLNAHISKHILRITEFYAWLFLRWNEVHEDSSSWSQIFQNYPIFQPWCFQPLCYIWQVGGSHWSSPLKNLMKGAG